VKREEPLGSNIEREEKSKILQRKKEVNALNRGGQERGNN